MISCKVIQSGCKLCFSEICYIVYAQMEVSGADAERFLETVLVSDLQSLKKGRGMFVCMINLFC